MIALFSLKRMLQAALLLALLCLTLLAQQYRLFERAWFSLQEWRHAEQWSERSLWLGDYRVVIEARAIAGLDELSALTYDPDRNSLLSVTNRPARIVELGLDGELLRQIKLEGFGDVEAIEYIEANTYVLADERRQRLVKVRLDEQTQLLRAADFQQLSLGIGLNGNKGFEGLAWDPERQRLLVAKERDPVRIFEIVGFPHTEVERPLALQVNTDPKRDARLFVRDLSSLNHDRSTGHLLVLSDQSKLLLELDSAGKPVSSLSLFAGRHGLKRNVPQAEGVASDNVGNLYLISEPNLFYVFRKP